MHAGPYYYGCEQSLPLPWIGGKPFSKDYTGGGSRTDYRLRIGPAKGLLRVQSHLGYRGRNTNMSLGSHSVRSKVLMS
jgi:hypothetical protein